MTNFHVYFFYQFFHIRLIFFKFHIILFFNKPLQIKNNMTTLYENLQIFFIRVLFQNFL